MKESFNLFNINSVRPIVRKVLRYKKSGSALDLGCGAGRHALFLAKNGFSVIAVDNRTEVLAALKELARLQKLPVMVRRDDAITFSSKRKFDVVLSTMILHFLPYQSQKKAIFTMQEYTKNNGLNVVSNYTNKNKKGTRPHLVRTGVLKKLYEDAGWSILDYEERLGKPISSSSGKIVRYWKEEFIAQKL
ncbi:MAG: methyltransferase domain-containing protein [Patescibacteria group bacterium]